MKRTFFWPSVVLFLTLALGAQNQTVAQTASDEAWRKAQTAQRDGRWDDAITQFSALAERYPNNANAAVGLGFSLYKKGDIEGAATSYRSALAVDAKHAGALYGLGQVAMARKQWSEAAEQFQQVIRVAPTFEPLSTRHNLGLTLHGASQFAEAVEAYREAFTHAAQKPSIELIRHALESALAAEDFTQSQTWAEAATELYPQEARFWDALAWAYKTRKPAQAAETFARAETLAYKTTGAVHKTVLSLPFRGRWRVTQGNGGEFTHRGLSARFAWDFEATEPSGISSSERAPQGQNERYASFGQEVLAPADGRVVALRDGAPDNAPYQSSPSSHTGNYILLEHEPGEFSVLAHLKNGSVAVAVGETVKRGQLLAQCGNSGSTALPHLHFSFMGNYNGTRISQPAAFSGYTAWRHSWPVEVGRGVPAEGEIVQSSEVPKSEAPKGAATQ
ncbi:MAG TPA: tetratricopeptide repeat protein [Abditibacteriaceae bacterium]|jgi:murein DD-endopeptidase MepM/ murein hydrolase activator NlpD